VVVVMLMIIIIIRRNIHYSETSTGDFGIIHIHTVDPLFALK